MPGSVPYLLGSVPLHNSAMKLITWNLQWGRGLDGLVDLARIVEHARSLADFDVLDVQEIADNFPDLEGNDDANQFARLASLLPGYTVLPGYGVDVEGPGRRRRFGNAIITRLPVIAVRKHPLPWPADPPFASMPRVAIEATLATGIGPVRVTTTHLEYYSRLQRDAQARRLWELHAEACERAAVPMKGKIGPFVPAPQTASAILTADFNFKPEDPAMDMIQASVPGGPAYRDAWKVAHGPRPHDPTFCLHDARYSKQPYCCDFIFVSEDLAPRVRAIDVDLDTRLSDHQPVVLDIDLR